MAEQTEIEFPHLQPGMDKKAEVEVAEVTGDLTAKSAKVEFFQRRRNLAALGFYGLTMLLLTNLTPVLHFVSKQKVKHTAAQLEEDAARYAVAKGNFPDPCMIEVKGGYYAFATRKWANPRLNIQVATRS